MTTGTNKDPKKLVRPEITAMKPYVSPHFEYRLKMDLNESPFDLPEAVKAEIFERVSGLLWQRYHDEFEAPLKRALAEYTAWDSRGVMIGNGSDELIFHCLFATVRPGETVLCPEPSFPLYAQNAVAVGGQPVGFALSSRDFSVDPQAVVRLGREHKARVVMLCSPNNPTGNRTPNESIAYIAGALEDSVVVVDEAYCNFADSNAGPILAAHPNLVLLRTFSKAFGMAGLRFGFSLCAPELSQEIGKVQLPHHVNFFSQLAALTMLGHTRLVDERVSEIRMERDFLSRELGRIDGLRVFPSQANFILVELRDKNPLSVFEALLARGILIRNVSKYPGLGRCLRLTLGLRKDNEALAVALREVLA